MSDRFVLIDSCVGYDLQEREDTLYLFGLDEDGRVWQYEWATGAWALLPNKRASAPAAAPNPDGAPGPSPMPLAAAQGAQVLGAVGAIRVPAAQAIAGTPAPPSPQPAQVVMPPPLPGELGPLRAPNSNVPPPNPTGIRCSCPCGACRETDHRNCSHVNSCTLKATS